MTVILSINESSKLDTFKKLLDTICQFTESFNIHISNEKVFISTLDSTHISIINCSLDQSYFSDFECKQNCVLGVSSEAIQKICRCFEKNTELNIKYVNTLDYVSFILFNKDKQIKINLNVQEIDTEIMDINPIDYDNIIDISYFTIKQTLQKIQHFIPNFLEIETYSKHIQFTANDDFGTMNILLKQPEKDEEESTKKRKLIRKGVNHTQFEFTKFHDEVALSINFEHLQKFIKTVPQKKFQMSLKNNYPLFLKMNLNRKSYLELYISPNCTDDYLDEE